MNTEANEILLPENVRKLLNADNREIIELCKKTSIVPRKNTLGQIYFSAEEVKKMKNAKLSAAMNVAKSSAGSAKHVGAGATSAKTQVMTRPDSQTVVNKLLETLNNIENNITNSVSKLIDERLEGMDDVVLELVRCKTENENLKNKINELNKENFKLKNTLNTYKPFVCGLYVKKEDDCTNFML